MIFLPWHLASAYILDLLIGDPEWLPHPVRWIGRVIAWAEKFLYDATTSPLLLRVFGAALWMFVIVLVVGAAIVLIGTSQLTSRFFGDVVLIWLAFTTLATRSLHKESSLVARALEEQKLDLARGRLSRIVSRDTSSLDETGILRALVETVSENISDGIVAPIFYLSLFGPVGALTYKAVNTMDSMLGYTNERYRYFGWFPARADDIANWIPARLSGWLVVGAAACLGRDWRLSTRIMRRDARKMKSPNAGFPEAAAAGALGVQLGGTNVYFGRPVEKPKLGDPLGPISLDTYRQMIKLMYLTSGLAFFMAFCVLLTRELLDHLF
jgi:adenosylcobinamide-phosphate synthase